MDFIKQAFLWIWDFAVYLLKSILLCFAVLFFVLLFVHGEDAFYAAVIVLAACLHTCWKPYRRKRMQRQLDKSKKEITRLEKEIEDLNAQKQAFTFQSISFIDRMDGHEFEHWCAALLLKIGFASADVTQASGDDGVDIIAVKDGIRYAIQCKCYSSPLGNKPVQEVHAGKEVYRCHVGAVMTNSYFTPGGRRVADATGTLLWDREWIADKILKINRTSSATAAAAPQGPDDLSEYIHKAQWYAASKDRE